jgi:hypothetical protein
VRDATFDGAGWTYTRSFRVGSGGWGLKVGVVDDGEVVVVYHVYDPFCDGQEIVPTSAVTVDGQPWFFWNDTHGNHGRLAVTKGP